MTAAWKEMQAFDVVFNPINQNCSQGIAEHQSKVIQTKLFKNSEFLLFLHKPIDHKVKTNKQNSFPPKKV